MVMQVGDTVRYWKRRSAVPNIIRGEVIKVNPKMAKVRWERPERALWWYYRGRTRNSNDLAEVMNVAHHNLELLERKGGPW